MHGSVTPMAVKMALRRLIAKENLRRVDSGQPELTQTTVAVGAGISQSVISKLLNGKTTRIDFETMDGLCKFFNVQPGDLFDFNPND